MGAEGARGRAEALAVGNQLTERPHFKGEAGLEAKPGRRAVRELQHKAAGGLWGEVRGTGAHLAVGRLTHNTGTHHPWQNGDAVAPKSCMQPAAGPGSQEGHGHCLRGAGACRAREETPLPQPSLGRLDVSRRL